VDAVFPYGELVKVGVTVPDKCIGVPDNELAPRA
jgi:hypothetical protein